MKKQNGITLIALIITIIVMLILVAVTVVAVVNSGLFGHAGDAATRYNEAQEQEQHIDEQFQAVDGENTITGVNDIINYYTGTEAEDGGEVTP